jgi:hypothetical protein
MNPASEPEIQLAGGRVTEGVVRVGETVRRPIGAHSPFTHELLLLLEQRGAPYAPRFLGLDERGREILSFHDGWVPPNLESRRWSDRRLVLAARLVRSFHDTTAGSALAAGAEVVCHGDLSPCNFVFVRGEPSFMIDFDRAHPGSRRSDLAYMAWCWLIGREDDPEAPQFGERLRQLAVLLDAYGLSDRTSFADAIETEQRETLAATQERQDDAAAEWVGSEIDFVRAHAAVIDAAAMRRPSEPL